MKIRTIGYYMRNYVPFYLRFEKWCERKVLEYLKRKLEKTKRKIEKTLL